MRKRSLVILITVLAVLLLIASSGSAATKKLPAGEVVYMMVNDLGTLDALKLVGGMDTPVFLALYDSMLWADRSGTDHPGIAAAWRFVDPKTVEIKFKKGLVFHNGEPFTAEDYEAAVAKGFTKYAAKSGAMSVLKYVESYEVVDDYTFVYHLKEPTATFIARAITNIDIRFLQPKDYIKKVGNEGYEKHPIGLGPYKFVERKKGEYIRLTASDVWHGPRPWDGPVQVKDVKVVFIPESETRQAMLRTGAGDIDESVLPKVAKEMEKDPNLRVLRLEPNQFIQFNFNTAVKSIPGTNIPSPFLDVRVRRAIHMAIDKKAIRDGIMMGYAPESRGPWNSPVWGAAPEEITPYPYDPERAKKLLKEANFPFGYDYDMVAYRTSPGAAESMEAVVGYLNQIGVKAKYKLVEVGTLMSWWQDPKREKTYPFQFIRHQTPMPDPIGFTYYAWGTGKWLSAVWDEGLDKLLAERDKIFDVKGAQKHYKKIYKYVHENALNVTVYQDVLLHGLGPRIDWWIPKGTIEPYGFERITWRAGHP
ncbi:MAG: ABC transporter substrate-binding protein [Desulfatiglandales bacterium]